MENELGRPEESQETGEVTQVPSRGLGVWNQVAAAGTEGRAEMRAGRKRKGWEETQGLSTGHTRAGEGGCGEGAGS